jgi:hypothetical protein
MVRRLFKEWSEVQLVDPLSTFCVYSFVDLKYSTNLNNEVVGSTVSSRLQRTSYHSKRHTDQI